MTTDHPIGSKESLADLARSAADIAANSKLISINLARIEGGLQPADGLSEDAEFGLHMSHRTEHEFVAETESQPPRLTVALTFDVAIRADESARSVFEVHVVFHAIYHLNRGIPDEAKRSFDAFAKTNSVIHAWPYFRELVQSILWRSGLPPFPLPLFRITDQQAAASGTET